MAASRKRRTQKKKPAARRSAGARKLVYAFGAERTEGSRDMRDILGGKGANLADMTSIGLPVPPGFTIATEACAAYNARDGRLPRGLMEQVRRALARVERETGKKFGAAKRPLLVSVRSGAAVSMPGMMDTVLNLGLTDAACAALARDSGSERFALDAYRRLINMFGDVVMGVDHHEFESAFTEIKARYAVASDAAVPVEGMRELVDAYKAVYERRVGSPFPQDPLTQLQSAIEAVFKSWNTPRAVKYRQINEIKGLLGTAVNVQAMVFGNMGDDSGTGVAFTRNPSAGDNAFYGEFLVNAQGEDVVAGIRTPRPISEMPSWNAKVHRQLLAIKKKLERRYRDMQDIEFTIERGRLFMLQTRTGKRTGPAAVRIAVDMANERLIDKKEALRRVPAEALTQLLLPSFSEEAKAHAQRLCRGLPASPGAAIGKPAFSAAEAVERARHGESVILVRHETSPEDIEGMHTAAGILTSAGGMTSHAAVVARGWGKCCVAGAGDIRIDEAAGCFTAIGRAITRDDLISIDGSTGEVMLGEVRRVEPRLSDEFATLMEWADARRRLRVRANADTPEDARRARQFGAEGIGLTRTEHMFFQPERIALMREMILARTRDQRRAALARLLPHQRADFIGIFEAMDGLPVTIRLLDPPLHEFLPHDDDNQAALAAAMGVHAHEVRARVAELHEANPMLGHRGCRLAVTFPEILEMQTTAIVEAMVDCLRRGVRARPEIELPLIAAGAELAWLRTRVEAAIADARLATGFSGELDIPIGAMIETPRAAITADELAHAADFLSFGTNDLTQMTFGFSRDDVNTFLPDYLKHDILEKDPFQNLDARGVGLLVEVAVRRARSVKKRLEIGVCGEHGGDPSSVAFFHRAGLDYVSCSPFRTPVARLAAAQAALDDRP
ncbi:MAG: pyruvate, phosphate dikinase [Phycisphaerales bacterium]|nr:pyruvate, phosphate dikinase [Phycisphaerales bacterium]